MQQQGPWDESQMLPGVAPETVRRPRSRVRSTASKGALMALRTEGWHLLEPASGGPGRGHSPTLSPLPAQHPLATLVGALLLPPPDRFVAPGPCHVGAVTAFVATCFHPHLGERGPQRPGPCLPLRSHLSSPNPLPSRSTPPLPPALPVQPLPAPPQSLPLAWNPKSSSVQGPAQTSLLWPLHPSWAVPCPRVVLCIQGCLHWLPGLPDGKLLRGGKYVTLSCVAAPAEPGTKNVLKDLRDE